MAGSPEYRALRTNTSVFVEGFGEEVSKYAERFFEAELISDEAHNTAINTKLEQGERARAVVHNITAQVKAQASLFPEVLKVLRELGLTTQADTIEGKYIEYGGDRSSLGQTTKSNEMKEVESEVVTPESLVEARYIEAKKKILDSNPDILTKDFPSGKHLREIAAKISKDWKTKYYLFKLEESDVEDIIEGPDRDDPVGQRFRVLEAWRRRQPLPTYENLLVILVRGDWKDAVDVLIRLCTSPGNAVKMESNGDNVSKTELPETTSGDGMREVYGSSVAGPGNAVKMKSNGDNVSKTGLPETTSGDAMREVHGSSEAGPGNAVEMESNGDNVSKTEMKEKEPEVVIPKSLVEARHIEKFRKAKKKILDSNPDILTKYFPEEGEHLNKVAEKISTYWTNNYHLFKLDYSDKENITRGPDRDNPIGQRQTLLRKWRKDDPSPTYENLLVILVRGDWIDAKDVLIKLCIK